MKLREQIKKLVVKKQSLAERCEICHQDDCFDPVKNYCSRCADITLPVSSPVTTPAPVNQLSARRRRALQTERANRRRSREQSWGDLFVQLIFGILTMIFFLTFFLGGIKIAQLPMIVGTVKSHLPWLVKLAPILSIPYLLLCAGAGGALALQLLKWFRR